MDAKTWWETLGIEEIMDYADSMSSADMEAIDCMSNERVNWEFVKQEGINALCAVMFQYGMMWREYKAQMEQQDEGLEDLLRGVSLDDTTS